MIEPSPVIHVVDDDTSVRRSLKRLIRSAGFEVEAFACAEEYLESAQQPAGGCLIVDVRMPGLSGLELQERLSAAGSTTPIIFITAHDDAPARERAMNAGAAAFLEKPLDDETLLGAIDVALKQHRSGA